MPQVTHKESSFEIELEAAKAVLDYQIADGHMTITHTYVPPEMRGMGIAAKLADAALGFAENSGLKVIPQCSYIAVYMKRKSK